MHYIHKVGCTSVRQVPVTDTCSFRLTTQIWRDLCLSETQIHRSSDLWVSHRYTCVDPQVTQTRAQPYCKTVELQNISLTYCPTEDMVADILTKAVPHQQYEKLRSLRGVHTA